MCVTCYDFSMGCIVPSQISAEKSVSSQLAYLAKASQARDNGRFVDYNGNTMEW